MTSTTTRRRSSTSARAEKKARADRLAAISDGLYAEVAAFNAAIRAGAVVHLPTKDENPNQGSNSAGLRVERARYSPHESVWVECANYGGHFCLGNGGSWERLLRLAGVQRDPRTT